MEYVTLEHKTSQKGQLFEIKIYTSSESWIKLSTDVCLFWQDNIWPRYNCLKIWNLREQKKSNYWENRL